MQEFKSLIYIDPLDDDDFDQKKFDEMMSTFRSQMEAAGLPLSVLADLTISNMYTPPSRSLQQRRGKRRREGGKRGDRKKNIESMRS